MSLDSYQFLNVIGQLSVLECHWTVIVTTCVYIYVAGFITSKQCHGVHCLASIKSKFVCS